MVDTHLSLIVMLELIVYLSVVGMQIVRRSSRMIMLYLAQSIAVVAILLTVGLQENSLGLVTVGIITFLIKCIAAPIFFSKFITREQRELRSETYLNLPITLAVILGLLMFVRSSFLAPLLSFLPQDIMVMTLSLSGLLTSLLLMINRRGILAQLIGIVSFENGLVAFSALAGIAETFAIEVWILFDILLWIIIAIILTRFVYAHFGTHDTGKLRILRD
jgi:hydrogenase-4 membrane subunit HyfE